ncbi:MAG: hypothetical protein EA391_10570 [Balneolaceae bacterium]|nr:MAG: hypothetical protein EA391_10570 [Balneolaceae bacterium]
MGDYHVRFCESLGVKFPLATRLEAKQIEPGAAVAPKTYRFETLWMALNQTNHERYTETNALEQEKLLDKILVGNCLSFFKSLDIFVEA